MKNRILPTNKNTVAKLILMGGLLAFFNTSCEKEPTPTKPHSNTYTFVYDECGIPIDTALAHMDVDTFYVIPVRYDLFLNLSRDNIRNVTTHLKNRQQQNPRMHGKGPFRTYDASAEDSTWLSNFGYNVTR